MGKPEDFGRVWEYTTTSDNLIYRLLNGEWSLYNFLKPLVYRDKTLWAGPGDSKSKKDYLVDPSEYTFNEYSGFVRFKTPQPDPTYIFVTLDYPYLRASNLNNHLCLDCHTQATHKDNNCLVCHTAHNTGNRSGIREIVRTTGLSERAVVFKGLSGTNSFADGDEVYDGICEVCHRTTLYYRRDGTGFPNHSTGINYSGANCIKCHRHSWGFSASTVDNTNQFDPCLEYPNAPTSLQGSVSGADANLTWTAPAKYVSEADINPNDQIVYNVYRRNSLIGDFPATFTKLNTDPTTITSFTDSGYGSASAGGTQPVTYVVTAINGCTQAVHESGPSDMHVICPVNGSSCTIMATAEVYAGDHITVNAAVCSAAYNSNYGEAGQVSAVGIRENANFEVTEYENMGYATLSIQTTRDPAQDTAASLLVVPPGQNNEVITISAASADSSHTFFSAGCSSTQNVNVWVKPCDNIPAAPTGLSYPISGNGIMNLSWNAVTTNTDGSPATYTPTTLAGDRIVSYEVWYSISDTDPNTDLATWSKIWPTSGYNTNTSVSISRMPSNTTFYFGVRAIDTCGHGMFSKFSAIWLR